MRVNHAGLGHDHLSNTAALRRTHLAFGREIKPSVGFSCSITGMHFHVLVPVVGFHLSGGIPSRIPHMCTHKLQRSRQIAFDQQEGKCYYCGFPMWMRGAHGPSQLLCTAEHLTPRSEGGSDTPTNIVAACIQCNRTRHKLKQPPPPDRYKAYVQRRVKKGRGFPPHVRQWATSISMGQRPTNHGH
jgi:hypothetical protein